MAEPGLDEFDFKARLDEFNRQLEELAAETDRARASQGFLRFLEARASFWNYSYFNQYLILLQRPEATRVAGLSTWIKLGRRLGVRQKPILILAPARRREGLFPFIPVPVYDLSQTKGRELPTWTCAVEGKAPLEQVERAAEVLGIVLEDIDPELGQTWLACSLGGRVKIVRGLNEAERASVLLHGYGHEVLQHSQQLGRLEIKLREAEAEAVSYVVSRALGMQSKAANYLVGYGVVGRDLIILRKRIAAAAQKVLGAVVDRRVYESKILEQSLCTCCGRLFPVREPRCVCREVKRHRPRAAPKRLG